MTEDRLARLMPNLDTLKRKEQVAALGAKLVALMLEANGLAEASRSAEQKRERVLADWRLVLAEISARENGG